MSRYERFRGKFSNFAAKQALTMEQKFGKKVERRFAKEDKKQYKSNNMVIKGLLYEPNWAIP